ncbi:protein phosphatase 4, regulatory subunit 2 [Entomophthora muscae]|uniref:Protein phosphatase 4, regulatory subunit 2 n=2 Tax=Entomophthora muscae TaxID=34485 RepID=A0ACC2TJP6_9FUNG|nr:protein phosphatase 4, regulatory subunit 2 [Entomophthora muscae]
MTVINSTDSTTTIALIREGCISGEISLEWSEFKMHLKTQLEENFQHFLDTIHSSVEPQNTRLYLTQEDKEALDTQHELIQDLIDNMEGQPFTLQRLCELLAEPNRHHPTLARYLRAITKLCRVSTKPIDNEDLAFVDVDEASMSLIDVEREKRAWSPGVSSPPKRQRSESPEDLAGGFTSVSLTTHEVSDSNGHTASQESTSDSIEESNDVKMNGTSTSASSENKESSQNGQKHNDSEVGISEQKLDQDNSKNMELSQKPEGMDCNKQDDQMEASKLASKDYIEPELMANDPPAVNSDPASSEDLTSTQMQNGQNSNANLSMSTTSTNETSS